MKQHINNKEKLFNEMQQKETVVKTHLKSVLEAFEYIVELAKDSNLDSDFFEKATPYIKYASHKLKLPPMQTVLLALFVDRSEDNSIRISEIASFAGCRTTKILRLSSEIDMLEEKCFLYKIQFNCPTVEARKQIWQAMLPLLTEDDAYILASQFDLSGGEIENITRKCTVNAILSEQDSIDLSSIIEICRNERISNSTRTKIGFRG